MSDLTTHCFYTNEEGHFLWHLNARDVKMEDAFSPFEPTVIWVVVSATFKPDEDDATIYSKPLAPDLEKAIAKKIGGRLFRNQVRISVTGSVEIQ